MGIFRHCGCGYEAKEPDGYAPVAISIHGHTWTGYGNPYFVGYGDPIFCLVCMDMVIQFFLWLEGYSMDGKSQKLVGPICHIYFFLSKYNHPRSYFKDLIITKIMV